MTLFLTQDEAILFVAADPPENAELRVRVEALGVCPVPYLEEPHLWDVLRFESAWETYGTPPFGGAQTDQPAVMLDAFDVVRGARAACSLRELADADEERRRQHG